MEIKKISELPVATTLDSTVIVTEDALVGKQFDGGKLARRDTDNVFSGTNEFNGTTQIDGSLTGTVGAQVALKNAANTFTADQTIKQEAVNELIMETSGAFVGKTIFRMKNARGTDASKAHNNSGDHMLNLLGETFDGTSGFAECGNVRITASQTHTATARGTNVTLSNCATNTTTVAVAVGVLAGGINANTTASAANVYVSAGNYLYLSTSSRRYKKDIEDIDISIAEEVVDKIRSVWYRSIAEADNKDWSYWGVIAEELAEVDPRLVMWGYFEDDYETVKGEKVLKKDAVLKPKGVQYDRIAVLMLKVMQKDRQRLLDIEARLKALEGK